MNLKISLLFFTLVGTAVQSQVGVNTTNPKTTMDVSIKRANADGSGSIMDNSQMVGLQPPRLTRAELSVNTASYGTNQIGALIYVTDVSAGNTSGTRTNVTAIGYYYFDGSLWQRLYQVPDLRASGTANHITQDAGTGSNGTGTGTGTNNIGIGSTSLNAVTGGSQSIAIGTGALYSSTSGSGNTAVGYHAGTSLTTGNTNIIIGSGTDVPSATASNQMNIGNTVFGTGMTGTTSTPAGSIGINTSAPGNTLEVKSPVSGSSGLRLTNLVSAPFLGTSASGDVVAGSLNPANNVFWGLTGNSGTTAGTNFIGTTDNQNLVFKRGGVQAGRLEDTWPLSNGNTALGVNSLLLSSGYENTSVGYGALSASSGTHNTALGAYSLNSSQGAGSNTAIGASALSGNLTGNSNVAIGNGAQQTSTNGSNNVAIGQSAIGGASNAGNYNTAVGFQSMMSLQGGAYNAAVGYLSMGQAGGQANTALGYMSLLQTTGNSNIGLGYNAGTNLGAGNNNIIIGQSTDVPTSTGSNQMNIGNTIFGSGMTGSSTTPAGSIGINTTTPNNTLEVKSTAAGTSGLRLTNLPNTGVLSTNANGDIVAGSSTATFGDIKTGIQAADHNGWIKLNGRAKSTLTATQQTQATALGIGANLPNGANTYLSQNGAALASISGSNTKAITQANLPNYNLPTATTSLNGSHSHTYSKPYDCFDCGALAYAANNNDGGFSNQNTSTAPDHSHTVTVSSGGSGTAFDVTPSTLSINYFIYLGN